MKCLILGGSGNAGRMIAELLLHETEHEVILASRHGEVCESLAEEMNQGLAYPRVAGLELDASDHQALYNAFETIDIAIIASSTNPFISNILNAAHEAGCDLIDLSLPTPAKYQAFNAFTNKTESCMIMDAGYHPGVPAALVKYASAWFDEIHAAHVCSLIAVDWKNYDFSHSTMVEFMAEMKYFDPTTFKDGAWRRDYRNGYTAYFMLPVGKKNCVPMMLEEMRALPGLLPSLKNTGFYIAGFNPITDYMVMPLMMFIANFFPGKFEKTLSSLFFWSLKKFSRPPFRTEFLMEAKGSINGRENVFEFRLWHEDPYFFTAVPVVSCLLQYFKGSIRKPGVHFAAQLVEPYTFIQDIIRMGIHTETFHHSDNETKKAIASI